MINGNTQGIREAQLDELEKLYDADMELLRHEMISEPVMRVLADMTGRINREISVYVARDGMVMDVSIGSHDRVNLPDLKVRRGARRLSGIRCIHTHPDGNPYLSSVDERTLRRMKFDAMISVGCSDGQVTGVHIGMLTALDENGEYVSLLPNEITGNASSILGSKYPWAPMRRIKFPTSGFWTISGFMKKQSAGRPKCWPGRRRQKSGQFY